MHLSSAFLLHISGGSREDRASIAVFLVGKLRNEGLPKVRAGTRMKPWGMYWKAEAGGASRLLGPLNEKKKNAWEGLGRKAALSGTLWVPIKETPKPGLVI